MTVRVVVFGREPAAGRVKSRLAATFGEQAAAAAYAALLDHVIETAVASGLETFLSLAGPPDARWARRLPVPCELQRGEGLGSRMHDAFRRHFDDGASRVVLVGSDCPALQVRHLTAAAAGLDSAPVVLGPSTDGGYWLVAQQSPGVDLFSGIPWSSRATLAATGARLRGLTVPWSELETLSDIDTEADLLAALEDQAVPVSVRRRLRDIVTR